MLKAWGQIGILSQKLDWTSKSMNHDVNFWPQRSLNILLYYIEYNALFIASAVKYIQSNKKHMSTEVFLMLSQI